MAASNYRASSSRSAHFSKSYVKSLLQQTFLSLRTGEIIERYVTEPSFSLAWDDLQRQFFCCGTNLFNTGFEDWKHIYGRENNSVPDSCCQRWWSSVRDFHLSF